MQVTRLELRGFRRFDVLALQPATGLNLVTGDNGAGKTSVLEALHLMAYGRSFRGRVRDGLVRSGAPAVEVFVEWQERAGAEVRVRKAGLRHTGQDWTGRLDGASVAQLGELCAALAVVSFEPGSHALVTGGAEHRRRYLDWGLFHVEHDFMPVWRRYQRALKQRNAALKSRASDSQLDAWDSELSISGEPLGRYRDRYLDALQPHVTAMASELAPSLGGLVLQYRPGWRQAELSLADALLLARERDRMLGYTTSGPHRADWQIGFGALPGREALSRGQAKLTALAVLLAQAEHHATASGGWPVIALDDLASELDRNHQQRVLRRLLASGAQLFVSGTERPPGLDAVGATEAREFRLAEGQLQAVSG